VYQARGGAAPFPIDVIPFLSIAGVFILVLVMTFVASRYAGAGVNGGLAWRRHDLRRWIVLTLGGAWLPALALIHVLPLTGLAPEDRPKVLASALIHIAIGIGLQALVAAAVVAVIHRRPAMRPWWPGVALVALISSPIAAALFPIRWLGVAPAWMLASGSLRAGGTWAIGLGVGALCYLGVGLGVLVAGAGVGLDPSPFLVFLWPALVGQMVGLLPTGD
jgi:hypothetical protein